MTAALVLVLATALPCLQENPARAQDQEDDNTWDFITVIFDGIFGYPFRDLGLRFDDYPYAHGQRYFRSRRTENDPNVPSAHDKKIAFEAGIEFGRVDHDMSFFGLRGGMRAPSGCDVSFDVSQYREDANGGTDRLTFHQYHLNIGGREPESGRSYQISAGFGLGILNGEGGVSDAGFSLRGAIVVYPEEPVSLRGSGSITFFEHATLNDFRAEVGLHFGRLALLGGVRSLISSEKGGDFTGPTISLVAFF